jgi:hypothetical protein
MTKPSESVDRKAFMRQFALARRQVARLAKLYPDCFDKNGRAVVATLSFPAKP